MVEDAAPVLLAAIVRQAIRDCQRGDATALAFLETIGGLRDERIRQAATKTRKPTKAGRKRPGQAANVG